MDLQTAVSKLNFIGPVYEKRLKNLDIRSVHDLIYHFPFRYDDYSNIETVATAKLGDTICLQGQIGAIQMLYTKSRKKITKAVFIDKTGQLEIIWFNQPFIIKTLRPGIKVNLAGKVDLFNNQKVLNSPEYEVIKETKTIHTGRLVPIYPETYGLSSKWLRSRIAPILESTIDSVPETLPPSIIRENNLISLQQALLNIHFPDSMSLEEKARERLAFDELFLLQLLYLYRKQEWSRNLIKKPFIIDQDAILQFTASLPFELTGAQKLSIKEIFSDLKNPQPMNRLLEGDVGSGKTVVAAAAVFMAFKNGFQSALMAPTEILAEQHYQTLTQILRPFGLKIELETGSKKSNKENHFDLLVGTHALLGKSVAFQSLGLIVIDEQHRFGVAQRELLTEKGETPHILTMTATPIPRTLALTLYGDLDLSVLDEMPLGRMAIKTFVVPPPKRADGYVWIEKQIKESGFNNQAFIICPLIEESESLKTVKAATVEYEKLKNDIFPHLAIGLLHGRMKAKEKSSVLEAFREGKISILVATPVVEVGIDIPKATMMIVEGADRFGLSQLHQLRGRVGRSNQQSYCFLFSQSQSYTTLKRLRAMEKENSGIKLAEIDLELRGPGEVFGLKQHGIPNLKVASYTDLTLIQKTKTVAEKILKNDPWLTHNKHLFSALKAEFIQLTQPN